MTRVIQKTKSLHHCTPVDFLEQVISKDEPIILKNLCSDWAMLNATAESDQAVVSLLKSFYNGRPAGASFGSPEIEGRFFYTEDVTKLNFEKRQVDIGETLDQILQQLHQEKPSSIYLGSTSIEGFFPNLRDKNNLDNFFDLLFLEKGNLLESIWIGNRTTASCHYDAPYNLACCVAGKRRFTLFPPEQINNLYPGPLDPTPGGQAISMVDFQNPDFEKHPRFRSAISSGQIAELEPGDAVYIPSMWWHHVEALSPFNILVNYWWRKTPAFMGTPMNLVKYALMSIRDRPDNEKRAWQAVFDYYIFGQSERAAEHIPEAARGLLGPMDDLKARQIRAFLINSLNR